MKSKLLTISIYLSGMLSFFLVDFVIARYETTEAIANWASIKSIVMIGGTLVLFGIDQVMVRLPQQALSILKRSYLQVIVAVVIYYYSIYKLGLLTESFWLMFAVLALGVSILLFGFYRSQFLLLPAQVITNGWKPLFLIILITLILFDITRVYSLLFITSISLSVSGAFLLSKKKKVIPNNIADHKHESIKEQYGLGLRFFISLMSLNLSLYLEQILLNMDGHQIESSIYFSHFAIILPLMMVFNGYIGFILGPYIRKNRIQFDYLLKSYWWVLPVTSLLLGVISFLLSMYAYSYLLSGKGEFIYSLAAIVTSIGVLRLIYILPSSYLGVVASKHILNKFILMNVFGIIVLVGGFYLFYQITDNALFSVAYASLLNWLLRSVYGNYLVWIIWKSKKVKAQDYAL